MVGENVSRVTLVLQLMVLLSLGRCKQVKLWKHLARRSISVGKCVDEVDAMQFTDVENAMNIFKSKIDREVFMKMKNKTVCLIWLKQQIR
jgi:hypothetical protein